MDDNTYTYSWFIRQFEDAAERAEQLFTTHDEHELQQSPSENDWSATECVAHLVEFGTIYYDSINQSIEKARINAAESSQEFRPSLFWRGIIRLFEPPYKLKVKTIAIFEPSSDDINKEDIMAKFISLQGRFVHQLERCEQEGINLNKEKISNPAVPFIPMPLSASYGITAAHQRRHLWQAGQVLQKFKT